MINHVRTLLMNPDWTYDPTYPWEEYIDPSYTHRILSGYLDDIWKILYARDPDRYFVNFRTWQYMQLLHSSSLDSMVSSYDSRITYLPLDTNLYSVFGHSVNPADGIEIQESGNVDEEEKLYYEWTIAASGASIYIHRIHPTTYSISKSCYYNASDPTKLQYLTLDGIVDMDIKSMRKLGSDSASSVLLYDVPKPINLPGSNLTITITDTEKSPWRITQIIQPSTTLSDILDNLVAYITLQVETTLFTNHILSYYWNYGSTNDRLAALLLAFTEKIYAL